MNGMRDVLGRCATWLWRHVFKTRGAANARATPHDEGPYHRSAGDRQRFWTEFRDGQRQATQKCGDDGAARRVKAPSTVS